MAVAFRHATTSPRPNYQEPVGEMIDLKTLSKPARDSFEEYTWREFQINHNDEEGRRVFQIRIPVSNANVIRQICLESVKLKPVKAELLVRHFHPLVACNNENIVPIHVRRWGCKKKNRMYRLDLFGSNEDLSIHTYNIESPLYIRLTYDTPVPAQFNSRPPFLVGTYRQHQKPPDGTVEC